jgi:hypothetical protein
MHDYKTENHGQHFLCVQMCLCCLINRHVYIILPEGMCLYSSFVPSHMFYINIIIIITIHGGRDGWGMLRIGEEITA